MKKRLISLIVAVVMLFSMLCPAAYADDETVSFDTCTHEWETPLRSGYSITIPGSDVSFSVKTEQCKKCKWYKHVATIFIAEFTYYSPLNVGANGLVPTELATYWANVWYNNFGKNATATKFTPGGGSTSGGGVGRPKGYADDNGTPAITANGELLVAANCVNINSLGESASYATKALELNPEHISVNSDSVSSDSWPNYSMYLCYEFTAPVDGTYSYYGPAGEYLYTLNIAAGSTWRTVHNETRAIKLGRDVLTSTLNTKAAFVKGEKVNVCAQIYGENSYWSTYMYARAVRATVNPIFVKVVPLESGRKADITINNNTWNGNIYTDNSTNLTYIYPQYTTVNEKNETVTNISNTPIIYNNETKKYYTYDTVTNNYYYITYEQPATPTPPPSPTPAPTEKPGGSISTPETGKPGGDTGDTAGILAVLVEIRDNMIQGFLDIKAAFVAGFAELSANFTLAIENLNLNITNIFNKKFPDQSTPETALPSPTPSPSPVPLDPILPETQNLIIPKMNSNTFTDEHGTWIATGSSKYSDVFDFFYAFDRSTANFWKTNSSPSNLQIEIPDPESYYIDGYIMRISKFNNRYAKDWTLQGSDDGKTWDDLDKQTGQNLSDLEEHKYPLTLRKAYKYYRLNMSNYASSMCSLSHFNLLGYDAKDVVTPTPAPTEPPSPSPAPDPGKPDSGDKTNNFWTIIFPNGGGTEDGKKGIFWALVSLILALIAFFANLAVGVGYLFPFLPDGVVMTINTCLIVIFLFTIIKFIMRSK
ncbi:hypothetical protein [Gemmiger formicilis]|jgi:hypothetical protein|uniref:hypothetical protein n=1 Tax=Gemmiger formicilis TaxID=745368 RepID=UPI003522292E